MFNTVLHSNFNFLSQPFKLQINKMLQLQIVHNGLNLCVTILGSLQSKRHGFTATVCTVLTSFSCVRSYWWLLPLNWAMWFGPSLSVTWQKRITIILNWQIVTMPIFGQKVLVVPHPYKKDILWYMLAAKISPKSYNVLHIHSIFSCIIFCLILAVC